MTPQEQIEEQYGHEKLIGVCRVSGDWIEVESTDEPCPHPGCDCGLAFFLAIRFDSPQTDAKRQAADAMADAIERYDWTEVPPIYQEAVDDIYGAMEAYRAVPDSPQISEGEVTVSLTLEEARHCAAFSSPREAESFLEKTQEVQVDRLARFFHSEFSSDRIAEWDDLEPLTQRIWNTEALRAYVFMLTGTNPLDELETAGPDQPGRPEGVAVAPSRPSRDITPNKEDRS